MVYENHGNLYLQDGTKPSIQLTHSGRDRSPILSDDGEKIVFYRGEAPDNVYSINADGSREQVLIRSKLLPVLGRGDVKNLTFVPGTHSLLFNTRICNPRLYLYLAPDCTVGIYSVDADSARINEQVAGLQGDAMQGRNFEVSPNGSMISVAASGHVDIYSLAYSEPAEIWIPDAILYNRTKPNEFLPEQYWLPDSSGLIAVIAADPYNEPGTPPQVYAAVRYTLHKKAIQLPLNPSPIWISGEPCYFSVSPDRNWILFIGGEEKISIFLGNLNNGQVGRYEWDDCPMWHMFSWSPDSRHFASSFAIAATIGGVDGLPVPVGGHFVGWIDASHYIYDVIKDNVFEETRIGETGGESMALPKGFHWSSTFIVLPLKP